MLTGQHRAPWILAMLVLSGCTLDPVLTGQVYTIETPAEGTCPRLDWHFVADAGRKVEGVLFTDTRQRIADLSGTLAGDGRFQMTAKAGSGGGEADISGRFTSVVSTISVRGKAAGQGCEGKTFKLYLGRYFARQGGGGGGGG